MDADLTSQAVGLASNTDFSILSLFLRADFIVKSVIIILIASSVYSWAIIFDKIITHSISVINGIKSLQESWLKCNNWSIFVNL